MYITITPFLGQSYSPVTEMCPTGCSFNLPHSIGSFLHEPHSALLTWSDFLSAELGVTQEHFQGGLQIKQSHNYSVASCLLGFWVLPGSVQILLPGLVL